MPLIIGLHKTAPHTVEVFVDGARITAFEPRRLMHAESSSRPETYGQQLWEALGGAQLKRLLADVPQAPDPDSMIALQVVDSELAEIPWEYLHDGEDFLIFRYLFVREVPGAPLPQAPDPNVPWSLLAVGSAPLLAEIRDGGKLTGQYDKLPHLQARQELDALRKTLLRHDPPLPLRWHQIGSTIESLTQISTNEPILLHYSGATTLIDEQPMLCLDDGTGRMAGYPAYDLAAHLQGKVYGAFLHVRGVDEDEDSATPVALSLIQGGLPLVVITQELLPEAVRLAFIWTFYRHLGLGVPPDEALYYARLELRAAYPNDPGYWGIPALYVAGEYEWQPLPALSKTLKPIDGPPLHIQTLQAPDELLGREEELVDLAMLFLEHTRPVVTIRGGGGVGKTALIHNLAERLRFHFTDGIYALTFTAPGEQPALKAPMVRRQLAELLGIQQHIAFEDPIAFEAQEQALAAAVQGRTMLLIFDNYETVQWRLGRDEDNLGVPSVDPAQHAQAEGIQRMLLKLARAGVNMLLTSLNSAVILPGETLYPGQGHGRLVGGLDPESGAELFRRRADRRAFSRSFPQRVGETLNFSPLAIELAAARWNLTDDSEAEFIHKLSNELRQLRHDGIPEQHRPVIASIRLSIRALSPELRRDFLTLLVVANPIIQPIHGAVIWRMVDESGDTTHYLEEQAHERLELLRTTALIKGVGYDEQNQQVDSYRIKAVVAEIMRQMADEEAIAEAYVRYARWAELVVNKAVSATGIDYSEAVSQEIEALLTDLPAALPYLPSSKAGWAALRAATIFHRFGRTVDVAAMLELSESMVRETKERKLLGQLRQMQGEQEEQRNHLTQAMECYREALAIAEELRDIQGRATSIYAMGNVTAARDDHNGAMRLYQQAQDLQEQVGDQPGRSLTLYQMANLLVDRGETDRALQLYQQAYDIQEQLGAMRRKSDTLQAMANLLAQRGDVDWAMRLYQQAHDLQDQLKDRRGKSVTLHQMANVLAGKGDTDSALRLYQHSLYIKEQLGDIKGKSDTLYEMGNVLVSREDRNSALQLYQRALELSEQVGDVRRKSATMQGIAKIKFYQGDLDQALQLYEQTLEFTEPLGDLPGKSVALQGMAQIYRLRGRLEDALFLLDQSLTIQEQLGDVRGKANTLFMQAQVKMESGDRAAAISAARESMLLFELLKESKTVGAIRSFLGQVEKGVAAVSLGGNVGDEFDPTVELVQSLLSTTLSALRGQTSLEQVQLELSSVGATSPLAGFAGGLQAALARQPGAAGQLMPATARLMAGPAEQANLYVGIANVASELSDVEAEMAAREAAVAAQRKATETSADLTTYVNLSVMLYNLAMLYTKRRDHATAVKLLEEVVSLDERTGHPDIESDRLALEMARLRAYGTPTPTLHNQILAWCTGQRDEASLAALLSQICNVTVTALRDGHPEGRQALSRDLEPLRTTGKLPINRAEDFIQVLQLWLRNDPGDIQRATQLRRTLPENLSETLNAVEQLATE